MPAAAGSLEAVGIVPWGNEDLALLEQLLGDSAMMEHLGGPESRERWRLVLFES